MLPSPLPYLLSKSGGPHSRHPETKGAGASGGAVFTMPPKGGGLSSHPQVPSTSEAERVLLYRKWFHELDRRRSNMQMRGDEDLPFFK